MMSAQAATLGTVGYDSLRHSAKPIKIAFLNILKKTAFVHAILAFSMRLLQPQERILAVKKESIANAMVANKAEIAIGQSILSSPPIIVVYYSVKKSSGDISSVSISFMFGSKESKATLSTVYDVASAVKWNESFDMQYVVLSPN